MASSMASSMASIERYAMKTETPPEPSPRILVSYMERVKNLLANIPSTPSIVKGPVLDDEEKTAESSSTIASTRTAAEPPSETSTAATSVESLPLVFVVQRFHVSPSMPIDNKIKTIWTRQIKSRLTAVLLHSIPIGTCVQEFMMVGKKPNALKPTLVITCGDAETKKRVEKSFKSQAWLQDLLKANDIMFIALVAKTTLSAGPALDPPDTTRLSECCAVLLGDSRGTSCGHLLLINGSNTQPQRHCTLGGLLVVKGKIHGLTAGHAFEALVEHTSAQREYDDAQDINLPEDEENSEASSDPFIFNDDDDDDDLSSISIESSQSHASICSTHISSLTHGQYVHTIDLTPSVIWSPLLNAIIPQSSSHNAQSFGEPPGECDWALLDILPRSIRMMPNKISCTDILVERTVSGSFDGQVAIIGTEIQAGYLHPSPVTMTVDKSVLHVRLITLDRILPLGSSGAWVILGEELCGFIIAIRQDVPWAYMMPIEPVVEDIKQRFETTDVRLPRRGEIESSAISKRSDEPPERSAAVPSMSNNCPTVPVEHSNQPLEGQQEETLNEKSFIPESQAGAETQILPAPLSESCNTKHESTGSPPDVERSLPSSVERKLPIADALSEPTYLSTISVLLLWMGHTIRSMLYSTYQKLYDIWCWFETHILRRVIRGFLSGFYYVWWVFTALYDSLLHFFSGFFLYFDGGTSPRNFVLDEEMPSSRQIETREMVERYDAMRLVLNYMAENGRDIERGTQIVTQNGGDVERSTR